LLCKSLNHPGSRRARWSVGAINRLQMIEAAQRFEKNQVLQAPGPQPFAGILYQHLRLVLTGTIEMKRWRKPLPTGASAAGDGGDGSHQPSENELAAARHQGELVAQTAKKLFG
jgi:hypothetical protein